MSLSAAGTNSLYVRSEQDARVRAQAVTESKQSPVTKSTQAATVQRPAAKTQKRQTVSKASWYTISEPVPKGFHRHDLITIVVHEVSKHSTKADSKGKCADRGPVTKGSDSAARGQGIGRQVST